MDAMNASRINRSYDLRKCIDYPPWSNNPDCKWWHHWKRERRERRAAEKEKKRKRRPMTKKEKEEKGIDSNRIGREQAKLNQIQIEIEIRLNFELIAPKHK